MNEPSQEQYAPWPSSVPSTSTQSAQEPSPTLPTSSQPAPSESKGPDISVSKAMMSGFIHGIDTMTRGLTVPTSKLLFKAVGRDPSEIDAQNADFDKQYQQAHDQHNIAAGLGNFLGSAATAAAGAAGGAALLPSAIGGMGGAAGLALRGAAQGATSGALMDPGSSGYLKNIALGAGTVGSIGGVLGKALSPYETDAAKALQQTAKEINLPVSLNDLGSGTGGGLAKAIDSVTKYIPFSGFNGLKSQQEQALEPAIKTFISNLGASSDGTEGSIASLIRQRESDMSDTASFLYNKVSKTANEMNAGNVPLSSVKNVIDSLPEDAANNSVVKQIVNKLNSPDMSFDDLMDARSMLNKKYPTLFNQFKAGNADFDYLGIPSRFKNAIDNDMDQWATTNGNPDLIHDYTQARTFYQSYAKIFDDPMIKKAMVDDSHMYSMVGKLLGDKNPYRTEDVMNALGTENAPAAQAYSIQQALTNSMKNTPSGLKMDLNNFVSQLNKGGQDSQKVVWGESMDKLNGLKNLMTALAPKLGTSENPLASAAEFAANHSGGEAAALGAGATALGHGAAVAGAAPYMLGAAAVGRLFNSPKMADLLLRFNSVGPNTPSSIINSMSLQAAKSIRSVMQGDQITNQPPPQS